MSFRGGGQRVVLPFGLDWADIQQNATETLEFPVPINGKPSSLEIESFQQFTNLTNLMKDSSFYTGNLKSISTEEEGKKKHTVYLEGGVNDGLKRYSDKYRKKIRIGKSITDHPFILHYFPEELHSVMFSKNGKKSLGVSKYKKNSKNMDIDKMIKSAEEKQKEIMDRLNEVAANTNDDDVDDHEEEEENYDDDFEDDEDDDYNAEKYFDDGDDFDENDDGDEEAAF